MIPNTRDKYAALIETIFEKTTDGIISWGPTSAQDTYSTSLGKYKIHIYSDESQEALLDEVLAIYNEKGELIERFSDVTLRGLRPRISQFDTYFALMLELHRLAGRISSGAEQVLDDILRNLGIDPQEVLPVTPKNDPNDEVSPF